MSKLTKNQKSVADKVEAGKAYTLKEASELVKEITTTKFDASLDIDVRLGVDPRKANQMVRGMIPLEECERYCREEAHRGVKTKYWRPITIKIAIQ